MFLRLVGKIEEVEVVMNGLAHTKAVGVRAELANYLVRCRLNVVG